MPSERTRLWPTRFHLDGTTQELDDPVVVEEPLEIRCLEAGSDRSTPLTVTMRTPGDDEDLVIGLLYSEGLIEKAGDIEELHLEADPDRPEDNRVVVRLGEGADPLAREATRTFLSTSACGVCGKSAVDSIFVRRLPRLPTGPVIQSRLLARLPEAMMGGQETFQRTGGLHAAALFDPAGELRLLREDVGRHNAVDKLVGALVRRDEVPVGEAILVTSGRIGFEITQKALRAGIPILAAVGAPTSLSLRLAERGGLTVVGFLRDERCNVYTHPARLNPSST